MRPCFPRPLWPKRQEAHVIARRYPVRRYTVVPAERLGYNPAEFAPPRSNENPRPRTHKSMYPNRSKTE
jgi:hypothetical protein